VIITYATYRILQRSLLLDNLGADYVRTATGPRDWVVARPSVTTHCGPH
jgi:ABC-type dipeptide/oligopeptide/nickel transport system permease component